MTNNEATPTDRPTVQCTTAAHVGPHPLTVDCDQITHVGTTKLPEHPDQGAFYTDGNTYSPDDYSTWVLGSVRVGRDADALRQARRHPAGIAVQYREHGAWTPAHSGIAQTFVPLPGLPRSYVNQADYTP